MENDVYSFALRNTLNEITNACPDITSIFLFKEDGDIISGEDRTQEDAAVHTVDALDEVLEKAQTLGGVEHISLEASEGTISVSRMGDSYLVTVTPEGADLKYISTLTNVLVPTVLKILEKIGPIVDKDIPSEPENDEPAPTPDIKPIETNAEPTETTKLTETAEEETLENHEEQAVSETSSEKSLPEPQVTQFIVENIGGIFASPDVTRIDGETLSQWKELYEDRKIEEVTIETFGAKTARCKVKPIKDSKLEGKGMIQIPDKIRQILDVKKGELVRVKPVIE